MLIKIMLPYLGDRVYIHGTTLYEVLVSDIKRFSALEFQLKKPIFSNEVEIYHNNGWEAPVDINAVLFYEDGHNKYCKYVYEGMQKNEKLRIIYDESEDLFCLEKSFDKIKILSSPYNFVKTIVCVNKILLSKNLVAGQFFLFASLSLSKNICLETNKQLILKFRQRLGDFFYTDILLEQEKIGVLGFKRNEKERFIK